MLTMTVEIVRSVSYVPPARVIPNSGEISEVLNDMTRDLVISEEEYLLVEEACQLGWSWQRIANELQGRTARQLMKIMADVSAAADALREGEECDGM